MKEEIITDPYISQITIEGFKSFHKRQTLNFSQSNSKNGSGLTLIVGENNSGKSSIFEALALGYKRNRANKELKSIRKLTNIWIKTEEIYKGRNNKATLHVCVNRNKFPKFKKIGELENIGNFPVGCHVHRISTARNWKSKLSPFNEYGPGGSREDEASRLLNGSQYKWDFEYDVAQFLEEDFGLAILAAHMNKRDEVTELMRRLVPFHGWSIEKKKQNRFENQWTLTDEDENAHVYYHLSPTKKIDFDYVGDGIRSLFQIVVSLVVLESFLIVIDEPELYLSPTVQRKLLSIFSDQAAWTSVVLITHSPYFINWKDIENGAKLVRISQYAGQSYIKDLKPSTIKQLLRIKAEKWDQPFLLSTTSKEIFFHRNVVFVEGQHDKALLEQFIDDTNLEANFTLFGYGSGGASNIMHFLTLADDIGINAGALFDSESLGKKALEVCRKKFGRSFKLVLSGKKEIVDDKGMKRKGFFKIENGKAIIKEEEKKRLTSILVEFNNYFDKKNRVSKKNSN